MHTGCTQKIDTYTHSKATEWAQNKSQRMGSNTAKIKNKTP